MNSEMIFVCRVTSHKCTSYSCEHERRGEKQEENVRNVRTNANKGVEEIHVIVGTEN